MSSAYCPVVSSFSSFSLVASFLNWIRSMSSSFLVRAGSLPSSETVNELVPFSRWTVRVLKSSKAGSAY